MSTFEKLNKLSKKDKPVSNKSLLNESKDCPDSGQPLPSYIFLDDNNEVKEVPLSKDSAGAMIIEDHKKKKKSPARLIHDSLFGK